ncbi:hypothetical protein [Qipengyuania qiaonensis]|uniref:TMhelix containing protein n=1 Tax=Qipengyuania qiaonensis TaxID=2867240 RepID=A0ABS7J9D2_9SPHN|nr:hypothetical protein [Qipengyuania qiaonensis]MBX7483937.1 hypothetical protein [Qipengyuania qiaonensis]
MGNIKLNPAIKLWGGLALFMVAVIGALVAQIADYRDDVAKCEERGGVWIGWMPVRIGILRLSKGQCELLAQEKKW